MSSKTGIEWTDATWNPVRGCSRVSKGCMNCYAEAVAARFSGPGMPYEGLAVMKDGKPRWTGKVQLIEKHLADPLRWKKPRRIFVNSMSDMFHEALPDEAIDRVFAVMTLAPRHTFQVLTKRPARMLAYLRSRSAGGGPHGIGAEMFALCPGIFVAGAAEVTWPLPNVWLGVSVEDQATADERIPLLLQTLAAVRFVSYEPALGPVDFRAIQIPNAREGLRFSALQSDDEDRFGSSATLLHWVIVGGESGPHARAFNARWARRTVHDCKAAEVAVFVKQMGSYVVTRNDDEFIDGDNHWNLADPEAQVEHDLDGTLDGYQGAPVRVHLRDRKGGDWSEWPADLRVREFPKAKGRA